MRYTKPMQRSTQRTSGTAFNAPATLRLVDTHCHLDFDDFDIDRENVLKQAKQSGVCDIIVPSVTAATWHKTMELCNTVPSCHLALGLHPIFISQHQPQHLSELENLIASSKQHSSQASQTQAIAVGEIGLDFYSKSQLALSEREKQIAYFSKQLIIAKQAQLPAIIHNRKAHDECLRLLLEHSLCGGVIHAFNGSLQQAEKYIELGFALGFGGMLTYERSTKLRALAKAIPLEHIVLETDAPDMAMSQHRGQRNSPAHLHYVLQALAEIKQQALADVAATTTANALRIFKL